MLEFDFQAEWRSGIRLGQLRPMTEHVIRISVFMSESRSSVFLPHADGETFVRFLLEQKHILRYTLRTKSLSDQTEIEIHGMPVSRLEELLKEWRGED